MNNLARALAAASLTAHYGRQDPTTGGRAGVSKSHDSELIALASAKLRFLPEPTPDEVDRQERSKHKLLAKFELSPFVATNEETFEDWVDEAAASIRRHNLCQSLFKQAWLNVADQGTAALLDDLQATSCEDLVHQVAKALYHSNRYVTQLEVKIVEGRRHASVRAGVRWLEKMICRYLRLCARRAWKPSIHNQRLRQSLLACVPESVEDKVRELQASSVLTYQNLLKACLHAEDNLARIEERTTVALALQATPEPSAGRSARRCYACGSTEHMRPKCPLKDKYCAACGKKGHVDSYCKNTALKDSSGALKMLVEPRPGSLNVKIPHDRTKADHLNRAATILGKFRDDVTRRAKRKPSSDSQRKSSPKKKAKVKPMMIAAALAEALGVDFSASESDLESDYGDSVECGK